MKVAFFDTHRFEKPYFESANQAHLHELVFFDPRLTEQTAKLAQGFECICAFVNDHLQRPVLTELKSGGVRLIALRSAGFNHVDLNAAQELGLTVVRVPAYSPHAVAEHAFALILGLNRKLCRSTTRVHELNFSLDGLVGFDLYQKTVGVIGTGKIGTVFAKIALGFGCNVLLSDPHPSPVLTQMGCRYVPLDELYSNSDIISLHLPLTPDTRHLINKAALSKIKKGAMLINTGRGALIDTQALVQSLKEGHLGSAGLDVYEEEETLFFQDLSDQILQDDVLARLLTFPNVMITAHQAFLTSEALSQIAKTTLNNISEFEKQRPLTNQVLAQVLAQCP